MKPEKKRCYMKFREDNIPIPEREKQILEFWKDQSIFNKIVTQTENGPLFSFFEGPPTANGRPGIHHVLSRVYKDIYIRYYGQKGFHIPRKAGWDCHGLPVEREVEKELGIKAKSEIESDVGLEKFNSLCRQSVLQYVDEWNHFSDRLGFCIDYNEAYWTMDNDYIEAVWSLLKQIWDKGLIYQGYRVVPFDPVMGATMSDAEVALGYKTVDDPSITVRFPIKSEDPDFANCSFLVWTTTPWTLPSNVALALHAEEDYIMVETVPVVAERDDESDNSSATKKKKGKNKSATGLITFETKERLICAAALKEAVLGSDESNYRVIRTFKGNDLVGLYYERLFDFVPLPEDYREGSAFSTVTAEFVTMDTGTGIVHIAPAYGADDLNVGIEHELPVIHATKLDGNFIAGPFEGQFFKDADKDVIRNLKERKLLLKNEKYSHEYPFGWRTNAPLMYYAKHAWYIRTTDERDNLIKNNQTVRWVPDHIKEGRFGNWLNNNRDWALSRERYWGTPLPVWTDNDGETFRIIGSRKQLSELCGKDLSDLDLHRPFIDEITFVDPETKREMRRVPEVIDCWFDSGAMPYAQWGLEGQNELEKYFPADFICEAVDQTRGWFYTLLAISTMVSKQAPYKNVICLGHVLDAKGEKMSKSKGNTVAPEEVFDMHGADGIRWYFLTGAPPGNSRRVGKPGSKEDPVGIVHGYFNMLKNCTGFFAMYANVDGIEIDDRAFVEKDCNFVKGALAFEKRPEIDRWILSGLQELIGNVTAALDNYDSLKAGRLMEEFVEALSNWYIRRNRRRFWKGELDADKLSAYDTLYRCLFDLSRMMAPFIPFLSEDIFHRIASEVTSEAPESVHLAGWPEKNPAFYDETVLLEGNILMEAASLGRAARMQSAVKVRQPLALMQIHASSAMIRNTIEKNQDVLLEELNVKKLEFLDDSAGILDYTVKPNLPLLGKKLGPAIKELKEQLAAMDAGDIARIVKSGNKISMTVADHTLELGEEELLIESISKEGTSGVEGSGMLVVLDTRLTAELMREGMVRDLVRNIQELRKKSGLNLTDRINLAIRSSDAEVERAVSDFQDYIESETLASFKDVNGSVKETTVKIEGSEVKILLSLF